MGSPQTAAWSWGQKSFPHRAEEEEGEGEGEGEESDKVPCGGGVGGDDDYTFL